MTTSVTSTTTQNIVSINLSNCAGVAGVQIQLDYEAKKLRAPVVTAGRLLSGRADWSVLGNDLGSSVKGIAYTPALASLPGGSGAILTITLQKTGKSDGKVTLASVKLAANDGSEIASSIGRSKGK